MPLHTAEAKAASRGIGECRYYMQMLHSLSPTLNPSGLGPGVLLCGKASPWHVAVQPTKA